MQGMFVSPRKKRKDRYGQYNNTRKGGEDSSFPILARGNCRFALRTHRLSLTAKMLTGQPTGNAGWFTQENPILAASIRTPLVLARLEKHLVVSLDKMHWTKQLRGTVAFRAFRFDRTIAIATTLVDNTDA